MLIARAIAEGAGLESRLDRLEAELAARDMPLASAAMLEHCGGVIEVAVPEGGVSNLAEAIDAAFDCPDRLIANGPFAVPSLFVSDMDSTMIGQECIDELADYAGVKDRVADITERAMRGELDFEAALRERVALLEGIDEDAVGSCLDERIEPTPGARTFVHTLKSRGARCVLVTGGFHQFADPIAELLGFDRVVGNRLGAEEGRLTGKLVGPLSNAETKLATLREERDALGEGALVMAAGDGANDVPMLRAAHMAIAYRAKPVAAEASGGASTSGDWTRMLDLLGVPSHEWVAG